MLPHSDSSVKPGSLKDLQLWISEMWHILGEERGRSSLFKRAGKEPSVLEKSRACWKRAASPLFAYPAYWSACRGWWRPRFTPVHASWLDQAELLNRAFAHRYLKRASWHSREEYLDHVNVSWPEYNRLYAHSFEWSWTNHMMRQWFAKHAQK